MCLCVFVGFSACVHSRNGSPPNSNNCKNIGSSVKLRALFQVYVSQQSNRSSLLFFHSFFLSPFYTSHPPFLYYSFSFFSVLCEPCSHALSDFLHVYRIHKHAQKFFSLRTHTPCPPPAPLAGCCCWLTVLIYSRFGSLPGHLKQLHDIEGLQAGPSINGNKQSQQLLLFSLLLQSSVKKYYRVMSYIFYHLLQDLMPWTDSL